MRSLAGWLASHPQARLLYEFAPVLAGLVPDLLPAVLMLLRTKAREVIKSVLGFVKVRGWLRASWLLLGSPASPDAQPQPLLFDGQQWRWAHWLPAVCMPLAYLAPKMARLLVMPLPAPRCGSGAPGRAHSTSMACNTRQRLHTPPSDL